MFTAAIIPLDVTVWVEERTPADITVRNSPVTAMAINTPIDTVRVVIFFPFVEGDILSINKPYCPRELHDYTTKPLNKSIRNYQTNSRNPSLSVSAIVSSVLLQQNRAVADERLNLSLRVS